MHLLVSGWTRALLHAPQVRSRRSISQAVAGTEDVKLRAELSSRLNVQRRKLLDELRQTLLRGGDVPGEGQRQQVLEDLLLRLSFEGPRTADTAV